MSAFLLASYELSVLVVQLAVLDVRHSVFDAQISVLGVLLVSHWTKTAGSDRQQRRVRKSPAVHKLNTTQTCVTSRTSLTS